MHFRGVVVPNDGESDNDAIIRTITDPATGDVVVISTTSKEYIYDGSNWTELGYESLYATGGELEQEIAARTAGDNYLSGAIDAICANYATKEELASETTLRTTADAELSTAIDNKVLINDVSASYVNIKKVTQQEYFDAVNSPEGADPNTVYIVNADGEYNMFDERITNLAAPLSATDATNKQYVDDTVATAMNIIAINGGNANGYDAD
jgi:hypothetical protein